MSLRSLSLLLAFIPLFALAQSLTTAAPVVVPNAPTLAVLLVNRPAHIPQEQWLRMMQEPVNRSLYPLRVSQAMLDTLDARQLDLRFQYVMVKEMPRVPAEHE